ncbi:MAG: phosphoribosylglycinamide formyltransferase [Paracoccaceae bacterium]|nr:MAG: phosphoribosylglycinamide formyltransferase [Paracoccaceae bacterium]
MGVPALAEDHRAHRDRAGFEAALSAHLAGIDVICLAGFMRVLTAGFTAAWAGRILNIHPSILPLFPGLHTHRRALEAGMAVHGATVHLVTEALDAGPILGQAVIPVRADDTPETLAARLLPMEHRLYPAVLARHLAGDRRPVALFAAEEP